MLLDVQRVAPCMPGATVESVDGDEVSGKIKVKVGPIALTYTGKATFTERDEAAHSVKIEAAGKETRGAGTASAVVLARLDEDNGQTRVNVHTTLNVTGRPAQFGRGVMAEVSGKIIEKFSANLAGQLAGAGQPEAAASDRQVPDSRMAIPIQELNLPARSVNSLKGEGIDTVGQLVSRSESELLSIRNLGQKSVGEIEQRLGDLGLSLAGRAEGQAAAEQPGAGQAGGRGEPAGADGCQRHGRQHARRRCGRRQCDRQRCDREQCDREQCDRRARDRRQRGLGWLAPGGVDGRRGRRPAPRRAGGRRAQPVRRGRRADPQARAARRGRHRPADLGGHADKAARPRRRASSP